jgi:hypothetical protein
VAFTSGALVQFDATGINQLLPSGAQSVGTAFGPQGQVLEVVTDDGNLTQYDALGTQRLGSGVRSAGVAFGPLGEVLDVAFTSGALVQFDATGINQLLPSGVQSVAVAFGPDGEVLDVVSDEPAAPSPEPTSIVLLGAGLGGLFLRRVARRCKGASCVV